tara:strand:+ start:2152 stop:2574 length:423 start_codon:yes stop_codon:yes gene_type:complete
MRRNCVICRECEDGYLSIAFPEFMSGADANRLADLEYPDCHVVPYGEYKMRRDPDSMSEPELRRALGMPERKAARLVAITGKLDRYTRKEATALIQSKGFKVASSVTAQTEFVIVGRDPGKKYHDAKRLGVPIRGASILD